MLEVSSQDIASIIQSVFSATFDLTAQQTSPPSDGVVSVSSSLVGIGGGWDGAVILDCAPDVASNLAAIMFALPPHEVTRAQIEDTLGELANMIGGNFKALLPKACTLSLPTVVEGRDYRVRVPGAAIVRDLHFALPKGHIRVLIAERGAANVETSATGT